MSTTAPEGARHAARVLVLSDRGRVLLPEAQDSSGHRWWLAPGGGLDSGETFETAARRELHEETGLALPIGQWVWTRRHVFTWEGRQHDQYERYFIARTEERPLNPVKRDSYVVGHRWWKLDEIQSSREDFTPRRLAELLPAILQGSYPDPAIDCGV